MATYVPPKRATAFVMYVSLVSQTGGKTFQSNPTLAAGDVKISKDGGALANLATLPAVTPASSKLVQVNLDATEMTADNVSIIFSDAAGAEWNDLMINIQTAARQIDDLAYPATSGRSMVVDASGLVDANAVKVGPSGSGTAQTAGDIPARLPSALSSGNMKCDVLAISTDSVAADNAESFFDGTGYAGTNNVIPQVTTTTNLTTNNDKTGYSLTAGQLFVKKNTQLTAFMFVMTDSTNHAPSTGLAVTATRSIDGAAFSACSNSVTEVSGGWYKITLSATDLNGTVIALRFTAASSDDRNITIVTQA